MEELVKKQLGELLFGFLACKAEIVALRAELEKLKADKPE